MATTADEHFEEGRASGGKFFSMGKLQSVVDKLANTVSQMDRSEQKKKNDTSNAGGGGSFASIGAAGYSLWTGKRPSSSNTWGNGRNGGGPTFGGNGTSMQGPAGDTGGYGSGNGAPPGMSRGMENGGGASFGGVPMRAAGLGAVYKSAVNYGTGKLGIQTAMDAYVGAASMGMGGNVVTNADMLRRQAFGAGNQNLNALAMNQQDAAAGTYALTSASGTPNLMSSNRGRSLVSGAQGFGYANPTMSYADAAQQSVTLNSARTSMQLMQMGMTPIRGIGNGKMGTNASSSGSILRDTYRNLGRMPTSKELNASLAEGGKLNYSLSKIQGLDVQAYGQNLKQYASLSRAGWSDAKIDTMVDKASHKDRAAQSAISKITGSPVTSAQLQKNLQSIKTGRDADVAQAFNDGLKAATDTLGEFSKALTDIMNKTGLGTVVGQAGGWGSQLGNSMGGMGNGLSAGIGMYGAARMLGGAGGGGGGIGGLLGGGSRSPGGAGLGGGAGRLGGGATGTGMLSGAGKYLGPIGVGVAAAMPLVTESGRQNILTRAQTQEKSALGNNWAGNLSKNVSAWKHEAINGASFGLVDKLPSWMKDAIPGWKSGFFAGGGVVPGGYTPGRDTQTVNVSPGEGILVPEAVSAIGGPTAIHTLNSKFGKGRQSQENAFPGGGVVGGNTDATSGSPGNKGADANGGTSKSTAKMSNNNTTDADATKFLAMAKSQIGQGDAPGGGDNNNKYQRWAGLPTGQGGPWCDAFVSWVGNKSGTGSKVGKFNYTVAHAEWFKRKGKWHTGKGGAQPGDVVFFDWGGSQSINNIDHVEIVESASRNGVKTIAGNSGPKVKRNNRSSDIVGYGRPFNGPGSSNGSSKDSSTTKQADKPKASNYQSVSGAGGGGGAYGSVEEVDAVTGALGGGSGGGGAPSNSQTTDQAEKNNPGSGSSASGGAGLPSGKTTATTYGSPRDIATGGDNGKQASGIPHHRGSVSSSYWPMGTKVKLTGKKGKSLTGTVEEFGPAAFAINQHNPKAIVDLGWKTGQFFPGIGSDGTGVLDFQVVSWGKGKHYSGAKKGGPGWDLAGGKHIPGWPGYVPASKGGGGSSNTDGKVDKGANLESVIREGMAIAGVSGDKWYKGLRSIAMHESGGDIKGDSTNTYDSNAQAGHPSKGLMQFIEPTFRAYAKKGYTDWLNPIHQVVADSWSGGYIPKRYGSIGNVPGLKSIAQGGKYKGYAVGSRSIQGDQIAQLHDKEMVIPASAADTFRNAMMKEMLINPVTLAGTKNNSSGGSAGVTVNIQSITLGKGVPAHNAQQFIKELKSALEKEDMYTKIQSGDKS